MLFDAAGRPLPTSRDIPRASRDAGAFRGSLSGWRGPQVSSRLGMAREREVMQRRAADLLANDWAANATVDTITGNAVGTGLLPKPALPASRLGITPEQARTVATDMEWIFSAWMREADVRGRCCFFDLQVLGLRSVLTMGELLHVAVMLPEAERRACGRRFSLAIQALSPTRLQTPADVSTDTLVRDGIRFTEWGRPAGYYIACPPARTGDTAMSATTLLSSDFRYLPARCGHRKNVFHLFRMDEDEQDRGVSTFARAINLFRNLADVLHFELFAQVIAASFPVFVATEDGRLPGGVQEAFGVRDGREDDAPQYLQKIEEGQIWYGEPNQKPYVLESKRPSANFASFVEIVQRGMAAAQGIPYESLTKDFSKTNYSSMRAALNEAWKVYNFYRQWLARDYCQPIYEMVLEEAFLRGELELPPGAPDFYEARDLWCNADWIGPARGFIDPVKEVTATVLALENRLMTYGEAWAQRGGDFEEGMETLLLEAGLLNRVRAALPGRAAGSEAAAATPGRIGQAAAPAEEAPEQDEPEQGEEENAHG